MRIGVLRVSVQGQPKENQTSNKFYNAQFLGISKVLAKICNEVVVYEHIYHYQQEQTIKMGDNITLHRIPVRAIGVNGIPKFDKYDITLDAMLVFSDIQLAVPSIYKWSKKNGILFIPYIGVIESHSDNIIKKMLMNFQIRRIINVYKKSTCLVKTPTLQRELNQKGILNTNIMPVGLDKELLHLDFTYDERQEIRHRMGYGDDDQVLLFVGRLTYEKEPILMIQLLDRLSHEDVDYKLIMIGKGELKKKIEDEIEKRALSEKVKMLDCVPNSDMWKYYLAADCYVNLNKKEIFGMAILEAMFYKCKVVAWRAPGPEFIIDDQINGYLVDTEEEMLHRIISGDNKQESAHSKIISSFTWDISANTVLETIDSLTKS